MTEETDTPACCGSSASEKMPRDRGDRPGEGRCCSQLPAPHWQVGTLPTAVGEVPVTATRLTLRDRLGHWRVRWAIRRGSLKIPPRLYAAGRPGARSPVLVTANFKMSFDRLRSHLSGRSAWILVLDTRGINVWCAAGKGTFGTAELIRRIETVGLAEVVDHRRLILPQLGATGVSAHEVQGRTGWRVVYGPVRARDLPAFLDAGMKATPEMRRVRWGLIDRLVLAPVELIVSLKYMLPAAAGFLLLAGLGEGGYSLERVTGAGGRSVLLLLTATLAGAVASPALLPWLPGRAFSLKGAWVGLAAVLLYVGWRGIGPGAFDSWMEAGAWILLVPAVSSFLAMNFTGSSTYTSLSGVRREMRTAVPVQIASATIGLTTWLIGRFV